MYRWPTPYPRHELKRISMIQNAGIITGGIFRVRVFTGHAKNTNLESYDKLKWYWYLRLDAAKETA